MELFKYALLLIIIQTCVVCAADLTACKKHFIAKLSQGSKTQQNLVKTPSPITIKHLENLTKNFIPLHELTIEQRASIVWRGEIPIFIIDEVEYVVVDDPSKMFSGPFAATTVYAQVDATGSLRHLEAKGHLNLGSMEGEYCIDDIARASAFLMNMYESTQDRRYYEFALQLFRTVEAMKAPDGAYYNFFSVQKLPNKPFPAVTINKRGVTSKKGINFWMARANYSTARALRHLKGKDPKAVKRAKESILESLALLEKLLDKKYGTYTSIKVNGKIISVPNWLPGEGSDLAAEFALAFIDYYQFEKDPLIRGRLEACIVKLCDGIAELKDPHGMHYSWARAPIRNGWGSKQVEALAKAGSLFKNNKFIQSALAESKGLLANFVITGIPARIGPDEAMFGQIAYAQRTIISSLLAIYQNTKDEFFAIQAGLMASWFRGNNHLRKVMWDSRTGIGYDGLELTYRNNDRGAESAIEAGEAMLAVKENPIARTYSEFKVYKRGTLVFEDGTKRIIGKEEILWPIPDKVIKINRVFMNPVTKDLLIFTRNFQNQTNSIHIIRHDGANKLLVRSFASI